MTHSKSAKALSQKFRPVYNMHKNGLIFCSLNLKYSSKNYNNGVIILNLFLFKTLKQTPINSKSIMLQLIQIQFPMKQQSYMQMQKFSLHFPNQSSDLGKSFSITSTKLVLDMTRTCPFIFQITQSPSNFSVGFLHDGSPSVVSNSGPLPQQPQQIVKCQHCDRVGHVKDHCFDLHP